MKLPSSATASLLAIAATIVIMGAPKMKISTKRSYVEVACQHRKRARTTTTITETDRKNNALRNDYNSAGGSGGARPMARGESKTH